MEWKKKILKKKQNPEEVKPQIRQSSEFEKKEIVDANQVDEKEDAYNKFSDFKL